jgi:nucleoside-diphosphate-sugar epimerase
MTTFVVTGGRGFIGAKVVEHLRAAGATVLAPTADEWRLGAPLPASCDAADAVIHLACSVLKATSDRAKMADVDLQGTTLLRDQHRRLRGQGLRGRFIFISSQSSRADAGNDYGRSKWAIEQILDAPHEIIVRPGLVYDKSGGSVFGVLAALAKLPVMPVLTSERSIQPIEVTELAEALRRIATAPNPSRLYELGASRPLTLAETVSVVARRSGGRPPLYLPFPAWPVRLLCGAIDRAFGQSPPLLERVDGLLALRAMNTQPSLESLDITLADFMTVPS